MMINQRLVFVALTVYTIAVFISQAAMSIGAAICGLLIIFSFTPVKSFFKTLRKTTSESLFLRNYAKLSTAFVFFCCLSLVVAYFFPINIGGMSPVILARDFSKVWYFFWPILLTLGWSQLSNSQRKSLLKLFACGAIFCGIIGISQFFTGWIRPQRIPLDYPRAFYHANGLYGFHLSFASIIIFPVFFCFHEIFKPKFLPKTLAIHGFIWGMLGLIFTFSRTLWIGLVVALLLYSFTQRSKKKSLILLTALAALGLLMAQSSVVYERMRHSFAGNERFLIWEANFELIKKNPLTGVGWHKNAALIAGYYKEKFPETYSSILTDHAHNNIIQFLSGTGILGLFFFLAWNAFVLYTAKRTHLGLFYAWIVFHLNGLTQSNFLEGKCLHMMMWVVAFQLSLLLHDNKATIYK